MTEEAQPKVLVGCPTIDMKDYCLDEYISGLKSLSYGNFDIHIVDNSEKPDYFNRLRKIADGWNNGNSKFTVEKIGYNSEKARDRIIEARNILREKTLKEGYEYFFSLEQDVIPPVDSIERLLWREKKIISGIYMNYHPARKALVILAFKCKSEADRQQDRTTTLNLMELFPSRVIENLRACGVGCLLIHRDVLEKVKFRYDKSTEAFDDWFFCTDATDSGFTINVDSSVLCRHLFKPWVTDDNI